MFDAQERSGSGNTVVRTAAGVLIVGLCLTGVLLTSIFSAGEETQASTNILGAKSAAKKKATIAEAHALFKKKDWLGAAEAYEAVIETNPNIPVAWFRLGYALHAAGKLDRAIAAHERAAEFKQLRKIAWYNLACAYGLKKDADKAAEYAGKAWDDGFANAKTFATDADFEAVRNSDVFQKLLARIEREGRIGKNLPKNQQFDFWIGQWDVYDAAGKKLGSNVISKTNNGAVILERWTSASGGVGMSMNYVDPETGAWRQEWIDGGGSVTRKSGGVVDGVMKLEGERIAKNGTKVPTRTTFSPLSKGRVRQLIEQSSDNGQTWKAVFNGIYVPAKPAE